jgi:biopolymer transport protein ExbB/TolQ
MKRKTVDEKLDTIIGKLDQHDKRFDVLAEKAHEHDKRFDMVATTQDLAEVKAKMATKDDLKKVKNEVMTALDTQTKLLETIHQEQAATSTAIVRHDKDIERIKEKLEIRE